MEAKKSLPDEALQAMRRRCDGNVMMWDAVVMET
jgi:hypothetical protein